MMFSRDLYNECFDNQSYLVNASAKDQYAKAWQNARYAYWRAENRGRYLNARKFHFILCADDGIPLSMAKRAWVDYRLNNRPKFPNYWQKRRASIAQSREQISAADVVSASYPI